MLSKEFLLCQIAKSYPDATHLIIPAQDPRNTYTFGFDNPVRRDPYGTLLPGENKISGTSVGIIGLTQSHGGNFTPSVTLTTSSSLSNKNIYVSRLDANITISMSKGYNEDYNANGKVLFTKQDIGKVLPFKIYV